MCNKIIGKGSKQRHLDSAGHKVNAKIEMFIGDIK
jgi:hypothetical protein